MTSIRQFVLFALLASVVMTEPSQLRVATAAAMLDATDARPAALAAGVWSRRLSNLLRRQIQPAVAFWRRRPKLIELARGFLAAAQVARPHALPTVHAFRLPPPF